MEVEDAAIRKKHIHIQLWNKINIFIGVFLSIIVCMMFVVAVFRRGLPKQPLKAFSRESNNINSREWKQKKG
jgi:hypothetical protein